MARGRKQAVEEGAPQHGQILGDRVRKGQAVGLLVGADDRGRVHLGEAGGDERVLDRARKSLLPGQAPAHVPAKREREGDRG